MQRSLILGHSWGSALGLKLAQDYPELIYGYIGVGQFINTNINEKIGYENALKIAYENNNKNAIKALEKLSSFKNAELTNLTIKDFSVLRKWQFQLNKVGINKFDFFLIIINALCVPEYSLLDYFYLICGTFNLLKSKTFFDEILNINLGDKTNYCTPIYIFAGRKDFITPSSPIYEYFKKIEAPYKEYIWFENSGHNLFFEETDKFVKCLCTVNEF
ncbi:MAG TPA: alpha/beta hydrolase [Chitinophagaceae bacterium]|nr:alpha/beta hydrolase [Chitinophagaceae bacterium]